MTDPHGRTALVPDRCTTHHHACDCREAVHREVAEALNRLCRWWDDEAVQNRTEDWARARAALEKYREMYP